MENSTNNSAWAEFLLGMPSPSAVLPASLSPDSQSLDQVSLSDTGDLAEAQDWFSSTGNNMANLATIAEDSTPRRPSIQKSPSKMLNDTFSPRRSSQLYVQRSEFAKEIRGLAEKLNKVQESVRDVQTQLQTVTNNHKELSRWTVDMNGTLDGLAQQIVEKIGVPMAAEGEWHMPGEE